VSAKVKGVSVTRVLILTLTISFAVIAQTTASVQGTVTDAGNNKAIGGAFVIAIRSGLPPLSQTTQTGADGNFQLQGLPAGAFSLCVQVPGDGYLDPCQFGGLAYSVTLTASQQSTGNVMKLKPASILKVRLNAAGVAQIGICIFGGACGTGVPGVLYPYGDQITDAIDVQKGYNYEAAVQAGCFTPVRQGQ
jgi:hypothetical protein